MKILSFQSCSLYENGGQSRVLRRLYKGHENDVISVVVNYFPANSESGPIQEKFIEVFPEIKSWMRWKVRNFVIWLRLHFFFYFTKRSIQNVVSKVECDVFHVIDQGMYSASICESNLLKGKKLWVSFYDHFSLVSNSKNTKELWLKADRRLLISQELGDTYKKSFGNLEFELITDGVSKEEISNPKSLNETPTIYFAGLLHVDYYPLFSVLADALDSLADDGYSFNLILRGTQQVGFLKDRKFNVEYRANFVSDDEIKKEIDSADILYLPIKFTSPEFYLYSLSTKLISYLGGAGRILYHGPYDSAACNLLSSNNASVNCTTLLVSDMINSVLNVLNDDCIVSRNAKKLAYDKFDFSKIQNRFWELNY